LISQAIDTFLFTIIGITTFSAFGYEFAGVIPLEIFWEVAFATYAIKLLVALIDTPFLYVSYLVRPRELINKAQKS
jgi:uncharacterized PurR-regulated membrane protein YhhQ (DUF165 family)